MKFDKPQTSHKFPAVIVYNLAENGDDGQTVIFLRDDAREDPVKHPLQIGTSHVRHAATSKLSGLAAA